MTNGGLTENLRLMNFLRIFRCVHLGKYGYLTYEAIQEELQKKERVFLDTFSISVLVSYSELQSPWLQSRKCLCK